MSHRTDPAHYRFGAPPVKPAVPWYKKHSPELLAAVFFIGFAFPFIGRNDMTSEWHECYTTAARHMRAHEPIYKYGVESYVYPPAMAFLATPLSWLSPVGSLAVWYGINVWATCFLFIASGAMVGAPRLSKATPFWHAVFWLTLLLSFRFVIAPLEHQQFDVVIAALVVAGCYQLWRGHELPAGALLGAATAMKCTPLLFAPYLVWRGKLKGAACLVTVALALNLLPDLVFPQSSGQSHLTQWVHTFLTDAARKAPGTWHSDMVLNQSISGFFNRLVRHCYGWPINHPGFVIPGIAAVVVRILTYSTALVLMAVTAWRFGRPFRPLATVPEAAARPLDWDKLRTPVETASLFCLMLLLSPMSSKAHYVILVLPVMMIARRMLEHPTRAMWALFATLMVCGPLTTKGLLGGSLGELMLAFGVPTWFVVITLAAMWRTLAVCDSAAARLPDQHTAPRSTSAVTPPNKRQGRAGNDE